MTFIAGGVAHRTAFMAADRTVSVRGVPYEPRSNKLVVVRLADAVVVVGYTGIAYFGSVPTDKWIAQVVRQEELPDQVNFVLGGAWVAPTLYEASILWGNALGSELRKRGLTGYTHEIVVSGLRIGKHGHLAAVTWTITHRAGSAGNVVHSRRGSRALISGGFDSLYAGVTDAAVIAAAQTRLKTQGSVSADAFGDVLIDAVRDCGAKYPGIVGRDVTLVLLQFQPDARVQCWIRFKPSEETVARAQETGAELRIPTPWLLTPQTVDPPQEISAIGGGWSNAFIDWAAESSPVINPVPNVWASSASFRRPPPWFKV